MAKYEFEWTDEQAEAVQKLLIDRDESASGGRLFFSNVAQRIEEQKPLPLPTKLGAVIRTLGPADYSHTGRIATLMQPGRTDGGPAWVASDGPMDAYWLGIHQLEGLRFEVLFEGVDL